MKTMEIGELSEKLLEVLHLVEEGGETIELARQGRVVARLVPANNNSDDNIRRESLLTRLQEIQIEGPTDLAANHELYSGNTETDLSQRLAEIRGRIVASGEPLMNWEEIGQEVAERRGDGQLYEEDFR
jgi:antitoxin (DNA-binding transcriptional repressor) of toxin-antitoxin stability system